MRPAMSLALPFTSSLSMCCPPQSRIKCENVLEIGWRHPPPGGFLKFGRSGWRVAVGEYLEDEGQHGKQQQHLNKGPKAPTGDYKQQPDGQQPDKYDPKHF